MPENVVDKSPGLDSRASVFWAPFGKIICCRGEKSAERGIDAGWGAGDERCRTERGVDFRAVKTAPPAAGPSNRGAKP